MFLSFAAVPSVLIAVGFIIHKLKSSSVIELDQLAKIVLISLVTLSIVAMGHIKTSAVEVKDLINQIETSNAAIDDAIDC